MMCALRNAPVVGIPAASVISLFAATALAQVAPSDTEYASYKGLHAAVAKGDIAAINGLAADKSQLNAQDSYGRTPLMAAAYARRYAAAKALIAAGADLDALENDRYDVVTIASVANDVKMLKIALSAGAKSGQTTSRYDGTALIAAAQSGTCRGGQNTDRCRRVARSCQKFGLDGADRIDSARRRRAQPHRLPVCAGRCWGQCDHSRRQRSIPAAPRRATWL